MEDPLASFEVGSPLIEDPDDSPRSSHGDSAPPGAALVTPAQPPCSHCHGIMGTGVCHEEEACPLARIREMATCPDCGKPTEVCRHSDCPERTEQLAAFMEALRAAEDAGDVPAGSLSQHCPRRPPDSYNLARPRTSMRRIAHSMAQELFDHVYDMIRWPQYHIVCQNDDASLRVRHLGGESDVQPEDVDEQLLLDFRDTQEALQAVSPPRAPAPPEPPPDTVTPPDYTSASLAQEVQRLQHLLAQARRPEPAVEELSRQVRSLREQLAQATRAPQPDRPAQPPALDASAAMDQIAQALLKSVEAAAASAHPAPPPATGLVSPEMERSDAGLMATLLTELHLQDDDLGVRPTLATCLRAIGRTTTRQETCCRHQSSG